ncbi:MAG: DUF1684 domain-containing protein [Acidobacteria bacterium]|nr:DUF1684 domain-containing protein [Acidobacteriota bacterium]
MSSRSSAVVSTSFIVAVLALGLGTGLVVGCTGPVESPQPAFDEAAWRQDVEAWHQRRIEALHKPDGWLTLVGLFWLDDGDNRFGSDPSSDLVFPDKAPPIAGVFHVEDGKVSVTAEPGVDLEHDGEAVTELTLVSDADADGEPTVLSLGSLRFFVIDREGSLGIRLRDTESPLLTSFEGIERFPLDPALRLDGRFEPYDPPKSIAIPNVLGGTFNEESPGAVVFELAGRQHRLDATAEADGSLFVVFGDTTNGKETYGGGRFLTAEAPVDGHVVVDFNRAYDPPCVFTPYATCPLPPPQNKLDVPILAGEKTYGHH